MKDQTRNLLLACSATLLFACSNSGGGESSSALTVTLTDAASDELASFVVEVQSVQLTRPGGATVGVLPRPLTIDLLALEEVSQVLNVLNVPPGRFTAATITFDFTNAEAYLIGETTPATLLDSAGNPLTGTLALPVTIAGALRMAPNRHRVLELDFDLDQSIMVDAAANEVSVEPLVVLRMDPRNPKEIVAVGALQRVSTAAGGFTLDLQNLRGQSLGTLQVEVDATTVYQVDGVPSQGSAGLQALAGLAPGTWVQCYGAVHPNRPRLRAAYVEAGAGTYNGGQDIVEGHVVGRVGSAGADATFLVLGHGNDAAHASFQFNTTFTVATSFAGTKVLRRGSIRAQDTDDVNVGQLVRVFGVLSGTTLDATQASDVVRLRPTRVLGFANGAIQAGVLDLDLLRVGLRDESRFNWSEGGTTPPDPTMLMADVAGLGTGLGVAANTPVEAHGFFTAVDDAQADFAATRLVNRDQGPSLLLIHDRQGGLTLTPTVGAPQITLALAGTEGPGEVAVIDRGFVGAQPLLPSTPTPIVVPAGATGLYTLRDRLTGSGSLHLDFAAFAQALDALLAQGAVIRNFSAVGPYDSGTNTVSAGLVGVVVD